MPIPDYQTIMRPLLFLVKDGQKPLRQCVEEIANHFDLTAALKLNEELTFSDEEIDLFLPKELRKTQIIPVREIKN